MANTVIESDIININNTDHLNYWSAYFNIHIDKLIEAAAIAGPSIAALHKYFQKQV
ncbi:MAG: DUF3606 domain-containing protein [Panacibacter sp.]